MSSIDNSYQEIYCLQCGNPIERKHLKPAEYNKRKFCNSSCSAIYTNSNRIKKPKKKCKNCGQDLDNRQNKYCNNKCQQEYEYKEYIQKWKNGLEDGIKGEYSVSKYIKRYLMEKYDCRCSKCGWNERNEFTGNIPLEVHHKDGDYTNNEEDNLDLLCPNCHSLTATYKAANKGQGRKERKKYT